MRELNVVSRARRQAAVCVVVVITCAIAARAQDDFWKAQWVTLTGAPARDGVVLHFRKIVDIGPTVPQHFVVDVSADNAFVLYANEKRVATGPAKSDPAHWRYEVLDLSPYLKPGKNILAATVWDFGPLAAVSQMTDRVGFLVHGETEAESAADTNETWQVEEEKGITPVQINLPGFYYAAGPGELWDMAKMDSGFASENAKNQGAWTNAVLLDRAARRWERDAHNNWQLIKDPLPQMEMRDVPSGQIVRATGIPLTIPPRHQQPGITLPENVGPVAGVDMSPLTIPPNTKATLLLDHRELVTGYPELTLTRGAGSKIRLTYAEALYDDKMQKGDRDQIAGKHIFGVSDEISLANKSADRLTFLPLQWRTWRFLQIDVQTGDTPVTIAPLKTWFSAYPFEEKGYFRAEGWEKIWNIGWRTARLDAHDTYMDTPYWERLQYIGDTRIQAMVSYTVAGDDRLARQAIEAFNNSRIPDGLTQSRYPSELVQMIPTFSLLWVGMVHDFWMYRGDPEFTKAQLPGIEAVLGWYLARQRTDGLLGKIPWWPFVDWGKDFQNGEAPQDADGGSSVMTLQFVEALRDAADLEEAYGDKHTADLYRTAAGHATDGVKKLCWNDKWELIADTPAQTHFSQHANILGIWLDVIPKEQQGELLGRILTHSEHDFASTRAVPEMTAATYYFRYYLDRAVEHAGMGNWYLQLLAPWFDMIKLGLTTWAEQPEPTRSDSHAWSSSPNIDLICIVAGIQPIEPGFARVRIEPYLLNLPPVVEAGIPTPKGMVTVKYTTNANGLLADVTLPRGVTGEFLWGGKLVQLHESEQQILLGK